jgi:ketosteroid isomerase-like protein
MASEIPDTGGVQTRDVVERFNDALNRHDIDAVMALMTEDCVFENTYPPPDGTRYQGQAAVRGFWEDLVESTPDAQFTTEELVAMGDRCVVRWRYDYSGSDGVPGHIRGIDLFRVRDEKVSEKLSYVKG